MSGTHNAIRHKLLRWEARINKFVYFAYETVIALFSGKKINILFSLNNEREEDIKKSFRLLKHTVSFDEFTYEKLENKDLVVPLSLNDIRRINLHPELAVRNPIPIPTNESMDICNDKYLFYTTLAQKDLQMICQRWGKI